MTKLAPLYPGYKASVCNGCGVCCLTGPCGVSEQLGLWKDGKCRSLIFSAGKYRCKMAIDPGMVSTKFKHYDKAAIHRALGAGLGCDHRSAWSVDDALTLLAQRNLYDEVTNNPDDSFPRGCMVHTKDGRCFGLFQFSADVAPTAYQAPNFETWTFTGETLTVDQLRIEVDRT